MSESIHQLMHRGGMMQSWSVTQTGNTWHRQDARIHRHASSSWHCQDSVGLSLPLWMCQSKPVSRPRLKDARRPLSVSSYSVIHADLSSDQSWDGESYFQQQGFPNHCSFIRDQRAADLWPPTFDLFVCVEPKGRCVNELRTAFKPTHRVASSHMQSQQTKIL